MTQHIVAVRMVLKQRHISYGSAACVLRFDIRFRENFIYMYNLYTLITVEPCKIHSKITEQLCLASITMSSFGMAYGPTMRSQPSGLTKTRPLLEWNSTADKQVSKQTSMKTRHDWFSFGPKMLTNIYILEIRFSTNKVQQEGWLSPTKRASAAKIN